MPTRTTAPRSLPDTACAGISSGIDSAIGGPASVTRLARRSGLNASIGRFAADDEGAATAEYAIATLAAVGFAGLLVVILRSDQVRSMLTDLIERALTVAG